MNTAERKIVAKEKKRIQAEYKAKLKAKLIKSKKITQDFRGKKITFDQFRSLMNDLNKKW
jgi:hypothetical protein